MSRIRVMILALSAALALSAVAISSASAVWLVNGTTLVSSAALTTAAVVDEPSKLLVPSLGDLTIECTGSRLDETKPEIIVGDTGKAESLKFLTCNTTHPASGCALEKANEAISTNPINTRAFLGKGEEDRILFSPQTRPIFTELAFHEPDECAFEGLTAVKGSVTLGAPTGQLELLNQAIVGLGSVENNSLEIGSGTTKAYLLGGKTLLRLANDSKWSFM